MSDIKWFKVAVDMFENNKIEFIRSLPEGDSMIVTWIQMMSIASQSNMGGYLMVTDDIPYTEALLTSKLRRNPVFMQFALETLMKLKMVNMDDGPYHITNWERHQNVVGMEKVRLQNRERKRNQREREKQLLLHESRDSHVTSHPKSQPFHATEVELDKEKDTTLQDDDFQKVRIAYRELHKTMDLPYQDSLILTRLLEDGFTPEHIIGIMNDRYKPTVKTLRYYEGAIRDSVSTGSYRSRGKGQAAHHQKPDKELEARRREIAFNQWMQNGGNPDEFEYGPA